MFRNCCSDSDSVLFWVFLSSSDVVRKLYSLSHLCVSECLQTCKWIPSLQKQLLSYRLKWSNAMVTLTEIAEHSTKNRKRIQTKNSLLQSYQFRRFSVFLMLDSFDWTKCYRLASRKSTACEWFCGIGIITLYVRFVKKEKEIHITKDSYRRFFFICSASTNKTNIDW